MMHNDQMTLEQPDGTRQSALTTLKRLFGFDEFLPGQREVIETLLADRSAAAVFPTGGGKSLCYQLPALLFPGITLVISPLIALMKDQIDALAARGIAARRLDSSLTEAEYRGVMEAIRSGELRLLYVAPERFNNERFRSTIKHNRISLFAVDEAHCISEWGHNFRPDYLKIAGFAQDFGAKRILALTATATPKVLDDMCHAFRIDRECAIRSPLYRSNLTLLASTVTAEERDEKLVSLIRSREPGPTIIYVTRQKTAEKQAERLAARGLRARPYHAGLENEERHRVQDWFMSSKDGIVVATIAFGMGVDKSNIRYVYHYNLPKSLEGYSQELGRAGRDGAPSTCHMLICQEDLTPIENFAHGDTPSMESVLGLVHELFQGSSNSLSLDLNSLSHRHDIRLLVLRTVLTYLEIDGFLEAGTPYFSGYRFKPIMSSAEILARFEGDRREFLSNLFKQGKKAKVWIDIDPDDAARAMNTRRERIIRALDWLGMQEMLEVRASGIRNRYEILRAPDDLEVLAEDLFSKLLRREEVELDRLAQVLTWAGHDGCQTELLLSHFGETLDQPCGHCSFCLGESLTLPDREYGEIDESLWADAALLRQGKHDLLSDPRAFARFLCGLKSPRLLRSKLSKHALFGAFGDVPFQVVHERAKPPLHGDRPTLHRSKTASQ